MNLKILKDTHKSLRERSVDVHMPLSHEYEKTLNLMSRFLKESQSENSKVRAGVGLAAPQIGINKRMFVIYLEHEGKLINLQLVNPKIIETSAKKCYLKNGEGCLSVDERRPGLVHRHYRIKIKAYNAVNKKEEELTFTGYPAIVIQHEYDHL
ncbi:MAG: peptide deformylase, partial [Erysipelotrichia bacterium]|nr:peptide deformylase [Erysipelotrichia bacterium]